MTQSRLLHLCGRATVTLALSGGFLAPLAADDGPVSEGRWVRHREGPTQEFTPEQLEKIQALEALGYLGGRVPVRSDTGVQFHDSKRTQPGLNLYVSGHAREAILMDGSGQELHRWRAPAIESDAVAGGGIPIRLPRQDFMGAAHVFDNGDLLAVLGNTGMVKLDKDSNVRWQRANGSHHDFFITAEGAIYTLTRKGLMSPEIHPTEPVLLDYITVLDAAGNEQSRTSIYHAFQRSKFASFLTLAPPFGDLLHTNTIEVLDGRYVARSPAFAKGNVLISLKFMSALAIVDLEQQKVVWAVTGPWRRQHRPSFVPGGRMLVFDNRGGDEITGSTRIIEFDPVDFEITWLYQGTAERMLDSLANGTCQRLPNGNTLIVESWNGRALEVTRTKQTVWEFVNPHRSGEQGELIAVLFDLVRLRPDFPTDWIPPKPNR